MLMRKSWIVASGVLVATALTFSVGTTARVQADDDVPGYDEADPGIMCYDYGTSTDSQVGNEFMVTDNTSIVCDIPQTSMNEATDGPETGEGEIPNGNDGGGITYGSYD